MTLIQEIHAIIEEKSLLKHPFYIAWNEGKLTKKMLQEYAKQYFHHEAAFPRYLSAIHSNCENRENRKLILENLHDEEGGTKTHPELWMQFGEALGMMRAEVSEGAALPETNSMVNTFHMLARTGSTEEALGAMYAYEYQIPEIARVKIDGLKKWYGIEKKDDIEFFTVHEKADEWHSECERNIFLKVEGDAAKETALKKWVSEACDALNLLLDGVYNRYCAKELAGMMMA